MTTRSRRLRRCKVKLANAVLRTSGYLLVSSAWLDAASKQVYRWGWNLSGWAFGETLKDV